jgi:biopolymer transport protein ExbD
MSRLVVTIVAEDEIYLNKDRHTLASFEEALKGFTEREEVSKLQTAVVEGDQTVSYSLMVHILDVLRTYGFEGVNLRMRETEDEGS